MSGGSEGSAPPGQGEGPRDASELPEALSVLLDHCPAAGLVELERVIAYRLHREITPAQRRVAELGLLARLLESPLAREIPHHPVATIQIDRKVYDDHRPPGAPTSETLVERYGGAKKGGWWWALRAAQGLLEDGRSRGPGKPWADGRRGRPAPPPTTPEHAIHSIRACALALGRRPSSSVYDEWVTTRMRRHGSVAPGIGRLCSFDTVCRHFGTWKAALEATNLTEEELAEARARRVDESTR